MHDVSVRHSEPSAGSRVRTAARYSRACGNARAQGVLLGIEGSRRPLRDRGEKWSPTGPSRRSPTTCSSRKGLRARSTTAEAQTPTTHGTTVSWRAADFGTSRTAARSRWTRSTKGPSMCRATHLDRPTREQATIRALRRRGPSRPRTSFRALGANDGRISPRISLVGSLRSDLSVAGPGGRRHSFRKRSS